MNGGGRFLVSPFSGNGCNHKQVIEWVGKKCRISKCFRRRFSNGFGPKKTKLELRLIKINRKRFGTKNLLKKWIPQRSIWKGNFVDAFFLSLIIKLRISLILGLRRPFLRLFLCPSLCEGGGFIVVVIANSFHFLSSPSSSALLTHLSLYKKALSPLKNQKVSSRTGGIAQSYLSLKSVRSGSNFYSKFRLNWITWQGEFRKSFWAHVSHIEKFRLIFRKASHTILYFS